LSRGLEVGAKAIKIVKVTLSCDRCDMPDEQKSHASSREESYFFFFVVFLVVFLAAAFFFAIAMSPPFNQSLY
jgi:hypothetical protein